MEKDLIDAPIQSLWIGGQFSDVERLCIQSFLDNGHEFHLYAYEDIKNAPAKTKIFDARTIMEESAIFRWGDGWGKGSVSGFADVFRILLLKKNGGWWVDMDIICLKKFDFASDLVICSSYEAEYGSLANNCVIKISPGHPFLDYCMEKINQTDLLNMGFGEVGPFLFQKAVKDLQLEKNILPFYIFNPISWRNVGEIILRKMSFKNRIKEIIRPLLKPNTMLGRKISNQSYAVHFWNEVWSANKFDKNGNYTPTCLYEKLKRKHPIQ